MIQFQRHPKNPILAPTSNWWECKSVFNPSAVYDGAYVHILYRAIGEDNISRLGYARSKNGFDIDYRSPSPVFEPDDANLATERCGVEDPRCVSIGDFYYITYVGASLYPADHPRPAFSFGAPWKTRICIARTKDFSSFEKLGVALPDLDDKDGVLFPEKINGRYALIHRTFPNIWICFSEDMKTWSDDQVLLEIRAGQWDCDRMGAGSPPVLTDRGWLEFYHAVDENRIYRMGAVLLDKDDPTIIISRPDEPCLSPEEPYEQTGLVPNVVFGCGVVEIDGNYIMYYGGADSVVGAATVDKERFLAGL